MSAASTQANAMRGEAAIHVNGREVLLRATFAALVRAEEELGSLFALVERAGQGELRLSEIAALFWFCQHGPAPLKTMLGQILRGR